MTGFVYIWLDRHYKRYYIGSHWGSEDDGYVCSSSWMKKSYKKRPQDFKRRILEKVTESREALYEMEHKWLQKIKVEELGKRYYNLRNCRFNHWTAMDNTLTIREKISKTQKGTSRPWVSKALTGIERSPEFKEKTRQRMIGNSYTLGNELSKETRRKISEKLKGKPKKPFSQEHRQNIGKSAKGRVAWNKGIKTGPQSMETKEKRSKAMKEWHQNRNKLL